MPTKFQDYYKILGVERGATGEEIQRAYRRLARQYHPDVNKQSGSEAKFKEIGEAYEVLKDPQKRKLYDQLGNNWKAGQEFRPPPGWSSGSGGFRGAGGPRAGQGASQVDFSEFFESLFGGGFTADDFAATAGRGQGSGTRTARPRRGPDHEAEVTISLTEAYHGGTRQLTLTDESSGQMQRFDVRIPAGVTDGAVMRLSGQGGAGRNGGPAGDLLLTVHIAPDPRFRFDQGSAGPAHDLITSVSLSPAEAALGAKVDVPTLDGTLRLTIPPGSQPGQRLRIRGQGMPKRSGDRGDLLAEIRVVIPRELNDSQRQAYEQILKSETNPRGG